MTTWHHEEMRQALEQRGWQIVAEHLGNNYSISGSWEIQRSTHIPPLYIDFDGLDDMETLPMEKSYSCNVRGFSNTGLYFRKQRTRHLWAEELQQFITQLDTLQSEHAPCAKRGGSKGTVTYMAPDFDATPEGFEDYV